MLPRSTLQGWILPGVVMKMEMQVQRITDMKDIIFIGLFRFVMIPYLNLGCSQALSQKMSAELDVVAHAFDLSRAGGSLGVRTSLVHKVSSRTDSSTKRDLIFKKKSVDSTNVGQTPLCSCLCAVNMYWLKLRASCASGKCFGMQPHPQTVVLKNWEKIWNCCQTVCPLLKGPSVRGSVYWCQVVLKLPLRCSSLVLGTEPSPLNC